MTNLYKSPTNFILYLCPVEWALMWPVCEMYVISIKRPPVPSNGDYYKALDVFTMLRKAWDNYGLVTPWSVLYLLYIKQDQKINEFPRDDFHWFVLTID